MVAATNPVIAQLRRGDHVESQHRGAWVVVDTDGDVLHHCGDPDQLVFARSSTKSIQALPLIESGAADRLGVTDAELALTAASHNGEEVHIETARSLLWRAGLGDDQLRCGPQRPADAGLDVPATRIANNCSGKHAGFLVAAADLGDDPARYLGAGSRIQQRVLRAMFEMSGADPADVTVAVDGCSAPTFRLPLRNLATALARMANPEGLDPARVAACRRLVAAVAAHPELVAGTVVPRFDTDVVRVTGGRIFAKGGAEGVQTVGVVGAGLGFAAKIDDGSTRSLHRLTLGVLAALGHLQPTELEGLACWHDPVRRNSDGLDIGRHQLCPGVLPDG